MSHVFLGSEVKNNRTSVVENWNPSTNNSNLLYGKNTKHNARTTTNVATNVDVRLKSEL
jgi:hypothetical protein